MTQHTLLFYVRSAYVGITKLIDLACQNSAYGRVKEREKED